MVDLMLLLIIEERVIDCSPALVPPDMADGEAMLGDLLEDEGFPVYPSREVRQRQLQRVLERRRRFNVEGDDTETEADL